MSTCLSRDGREGSLAEPRGAAVAGGGQARRLPPTTTPRMCSRSGIIVLIITRPPRLARRGQGRAAGSHGKNSTGRVFAPAPRWPPPASPPRAAPRGWQPAAARERRPAPRARASGAPQRHRPADTPPLGCSRAPSAGQQPPPECTGARAGAAPRCYRGAGQAPPDGVG